MGNAEPCVKPRVYQGVRVKTTVKELLQRLRAREANSKKVKTIPQACLDPPELCASTIPSRYADPPTAVSPVDASNYARVFQLRAAASPFPESSCNMQMEAAAAGDVQQQFGDMMLPGNGYSYSASLPPPPSLPLPWCHGLSSDVDYYGMAPCSSPESLNLCNPMDPNSYSPQDSFSSSSSCYDSPPRMESSYHGTTSEHFHSQHCSFQDCYCLSHCWPSQQESFPAPEYSTYCPPSDYPYACPVEENYLKRDLQMSSEMCYNVL
ncbi:uncharacterized protein V6R79_024032 [Siganus canaliculatus]